LNASWTSQGQFWQPQSYVVTACHVRSLSKAAVAVEAADACHEAMVEARDSPSGRVASAVIAGLQAFSEYNVTVTGSMEWFAKNTSVAFPARTSKQKLPYNVVITLTSIPLLTVLCMWVGMFQVFSQTTGQIKTKLCTGSSYGSGVVIGYSNLNYFDYLWYLI